MVPAPNVRNMIKTLCVKFLYGAEENENTIIRFSLQRPSTTIRYWESFLKGYKCEIISRSS